MTYIRHPEARARPLKPGSPRRATARAVPVILRGPRKEARAPQDDGDRSVVGATHITRHDGTLTSPAILRCFGQSLDVCCAREDSMKSRAFAAIVVAASLNIGSASAQQPTNPIDAFLAGAKAAAQFDFTGTLARLCVLPQTAPGPDVAPQPPPERATWYTDPGKVFDNLYFVGTKIHSSWALTTSEGIILIDTVYDYNSEEIGRASCRERV